MQGTTNTERVGRVERYDHRPDRKVRNRAADLRRQERRSERRRAALQRQAAEGEQRQAEAV